MLEIGEKTAANLALLLALIGLLGLYFYPQGGGYEKTAVAAVAIAEEGARVEIEGVASSVEEKESSTSIKLCNAADSCVSVSVPKNADADYAVLKGDKIAVFGQVATYKYAKFVRAERIIHGS